MSKKPSSRPATARRLERSLATLVRSEHRIRAGFRPLLGEIARALGVRRVSVMILDPRTQRLQIAEAIGISPKLQRTISVPIDRGVSGWVFRKGRPLLVNDIRRDSRFKPQARRYRQNALLSIPLKRRGRVFGVLNVTDLRGAQRFTQSDLRTLSLFGYLLSLLVENQVLEVQFNQLERITLNDLAMIYHELQTPIACIREAMDLMQKPDEPAQMMQVQRRCVEIARKNVERLHQLVGEFLQAARQESLGGDESRERFDLAELISELVGSTQLTADRRKVRLSRQGPSDNVLIWGLQSKVLKAVNNLVDNAVKYTPGGGEVTVALEEHGTTVQVAVRDTGPGMSAEDCQKIFSPYYRLSREGQAVGTGLGLYLSRGIIEQHGGQVWVESQVGKGSTFFIRLPKSQRADGMPPPVRKQASGAH